MQKHTSSRYARYSTSGLLTLALLAAPFSSALAVANEITTVNFNAQVAVSAAVDGNYFDFINPTSALTGVGAEIIVRVPDQMVLNTFEAGDVTFVDTTTGANLAGGAVSFDATAREISYTLDADDNLAASDVVRVTFATNGVDSFITTPAGDTSSGQYAFAIRLTDASAVVQKTGVALLAVNNTLDVVATVQEALVLTVDDTSLNLNVDPSINNGEDYSQKTVLTVATNAKSGYKIQGSLDNGLGAAGLRNITTGDLITAGDAEGAENRFGYISYNGDGAASPDITGTATRTQTQIKSDVGAMSSFTNVSANMTNVPATAANVVPTANGLGYSTVANASKHTVYYGLNVDYTTPAGTYTGTITYTAVPTF